MGNKVRTVSAKAMSALKLALALLLLASLLVSGTYAWFTVNLTSSVDSDYITVSADAGLKLSYGEDFETQGEISINKQAPDVVLSECSSVDGRNIFFPISDYSKSSNADKEFVQDVTTDDLIFREATANDKNKKYISFDFEIYAASSSDIWLSNRSYITGSAASAIRISFDLHNGEAPIVLDNTPATYENINHAVETIDTDGQMLTTAEQKPLAFGDYVNNGTNKTPLFSLPADSEVVITMTIWLEGTDPDCTESVLSKDDLKINVEFSTVVEDLNSVTFIDHTLEKWIEDTNSKVFVQDANNTSMLYSMTKSEPYDYSWTVDLPTNVTNINFVRKDPNVSSGEWNYWNAGEIDDSRVYNALGHSGGVWGSNLAVKTVTFIDNTYNDAVFSKSGFEDTNRLRVSYTFNGTTVVPYKTSYSGVIDLNGAKVHNIYRVNVPANATDFKFTAYSSAADTSADRTWSCAGVSTGKYFAAYSESAGYWGNDLLYYDVDDTVYTASGYAATYFFNSSSEQWAAAGKTGLTYDGVYYNIIVVPSDMTDVVFTRQEPGYAPSWDHDWNQTGNCSIESNNICRIYFNNTENRIYIVQDNVASLDNVL